MERTLVKNFNNFRGRDVRSSDLVRDADYAIEFDNARVAKEDSCVSREGFKRRTKIAAQYHGLYSYTYTDSTGEAQSEIISLSGNVHRRSQTNFLRFIYAAYIPTATTAILSNTLDPVTGNYCFCITAAATGLVLINMNLGTGLESSPVTLTDLANELTSLGYFAAVSLTASGSIPAAFLPPIYSEQLTNAVPYIIYIDEWEKMNTLNNNVFSAYHDARGNDAWEMASCENLRNCLYIGTGYNYLHKYDGQNVYRAGLPEATTTATVALGAVGYTDTNVGYIYLYKQVDNQGNTVLGVESTVSALVSPANQRVTVTVANVLAASGFNTGCAIVNANQVNATILTVANTPHTLKIGDTAYVLNRATGLYVERAITATTATTITIDGAGIDVNIGDVISNNLRIVIYRSTAGGSLYYQVAEIPNNSFAATQAYVDTLATASLGAQYIPPSSPRDILDIKPKYLRAHQDLLIAGGDPAYANTWFYSNEEGPEYFDAEVNFEEIKATGGGGLRGIGSDQEHLIIGTSNSLFAVTGDIANGNARQEKINSGGVGFACHNSIVDVGGALMFLSSQGFYGLTNGYNLEEVGAPINSDFDEEGKLSIELPQLRRSFAILFQPQDEYICFVPAESGSGTGKYVNENGVAHVYDLFHKAWSRWTNLNMGGGVTECGGNLFFLSKISDSGLTVGAHLWERHNAGVLGDYADHEKPIRFKFGTQWIDGGEPTVFKVFLWLKIYNLLRRALSGVFDLSVRVERDFIKDVDWFDFDLSFGTGRSGWGLFQWGGVPWISTQSQIRKMKFRSGKAQAVRYIMENQTLHEKVAISAFETVVTVPYEKTLKD